MIIEAILTPAEIAGLPERDLSDATCVVFDVLRATSTMLIALAHGARRIYPVSTVEEALDLKRTRLPGALLGGERGGVRIDGFDLGNSPLEYRPEIVAGRDIISSTTNGTVALRACSGANELLAGAWLNLDAMAGWLWARLEGMRRVMVVCAGTGAHFALEDGLAAGGLISRLSSRLPQSRVALDDAALAMLNIYKAAGHEPLDILRASGNGRRLIEIGLGADVNECVATTALPWVATMRERTFIEVEK